MPKDLSESSSDEEQNADIVQLFASEEELDENAERPKVNNSAPSTCNGPGKGPGKKQEMQRARDTESSKTQTRSRRYASIR